MKLNTPREEVVKMLEDLILEGKLKPGEKLLPERELASVLKISRPVVHEGLIDLAGKGLVSIKPRHGCWINDYRRSGSMELLNALYRYGGGKLEPSLDEGLEEMRRIIVTASVERILSHGGRINNCLAALDNELLRWKKLNNRPAEILAEADFDFYFIILNESGNPVFPLMFNSAGDIYRSLLTRFFAEPGRYEKVTELKEELIRMMRKKDSRSIGEAVIKLCSYSTYGAGNE